MAVVLEELVAASVGAVVATAIAAVTTAAAVRVASVGAVVATGVAAVAAAAAGAIAVPEGASVGHCTDFTGDTVRVSGGGGTAAVVAAADDESAADDDTLDAFCVVVLPCSMGQPLLWYSQHQAFIAGAQPV